MEKCDVIGCMTAHPHFKASILVNWQVQNPTMDGHFHDLCRNVSILNVGHISDNEWK